MRKLPMLWIFGHIRKRIPAIALLTVAQVGQALLSVFFALGTRGVIDSAVTGDMNVFCPACLKQAGIIVGILVCVALLRHLRDPLSVDLERDWKRSLLHGLIHGGYAAVSQYHSAELRNRLNGDVSRINGSVLSIFHNAATMVTRLVAAVVVLSTLDARFTLVIAGLGVVVLLVTGMVRRRLMGKYLELLDGVADSVAFYRLQWNMDPRAAEISYEAMSGKYVSNV